MLKNKKLRRSMLATPATNDWMFERAANSGADIVFLDLEDSVAPSAKHVGREKAVLALQQHDWGNTERAVRINGLDTQWAHDDVIELVTEAHGSLDALVLPKVTSARDVWWVDLLLNQLESKLKLEKCIRIHAIIESADGLLNVEQIAGSTKRLDSIVFGSGDYSVSLGMRLGADLKPAERKFIGDIWQYPRNRIVVAARCWDVAAIDAGYLDFRDREGFEYEASHAAVLGFDGKLVIHPAQVPVANRVFTPTDTEVSMATRYLESYAAANRVGKGALELNGTFIDAMHMRSAKRVLEQARLIN